MADIATCLGTLVMLGTSFLLAMMLFVRGRVPIAKSKTDRKVSRIPPCGGSMPARNGLLVCLSRRRDNGRDRRNLDVSLLPARPRRHELGHAVHAVMALLLISVFTGRIYTGSVGMQGAFWAMRGGDVDRNWAEEIPRSLAGRTGRTSPGGAVVKAFATGILAAVALAAGTYAALQAFTVTSVKRIKDRPPNIEGVNEKHAMKPQEEGSPQFVISISG